MVASNDKVFKSVIFDMGGVLMTSSDPKILKIFKMFTVGGKIAEQVVQMDMGELSIEEFIQTIPVDSEEYQLFSQANGQKLDELNDFMHRDENFQKCIKVLKENGYKIALLTNNFFYDKTKTKTTIMSDLSMFDVVIESCKVGLRKPDEAIYKLTLEKLGLSGEECVFVDDLKVNCEGAELLGITSVHVTVGDSEKAVKEIEKLLGLSIL
uniref:HAD family phosphatase n=1 Tax=Rhabditophanes sp. KR3021 TaxID=114890 RepID=A0AC35TJ97_9BILA